MLAGSMEVAPYLDFVAAQRDKATGVRQADLTLLLAELYTGVEQPKPAIPLINQLLADEPDSITLINLAGQAYALANDTAAWKALLAPRLARKPTDPDLLRAQTQMLATAHDFAAARASEKAVFDSGKANSNDYNSYAWLALFDNHLTQDVTEATQQSNMLSKNSSFADLHTEACIYAAQGKVTEAQQVLTQSMTAGNLAQPNSAIWYALGLLYEDYGLPAAALAAYNKVEAHEFDDHHFIDAEATYTLAQARIHALSQAK
jgi:predicted Zn-dependent protease